MRGQLHTSANDELRALLVRLRTEAGLSQEAAARKLNRPQSWLSRIERAERRCDAIEAVLLSRLYGVDPCFVVREIERFLDASWS